MRKLSGIAAGLFLAFSGATIAAPVAEKVTLPELSQLDQHFTASKRIAALLTRGHYLPVQIDDKLSAKVFDQYLDSLDYYHNVMLKSDIDAFAQYKFQFDDAIQKAIATGEGQTIWMKSIGVNTKGEQVSEMEFEWTIKVKNKQ